MPTRYKVTTTMTQKDATNSAEELSEIHGPLENKSPLNEIRKRYENEGKLETISDSRHDDHDPAKRILVTHWTDQATYDAYMAEIYAAIDGGAVSHADKLNFEVTAETVTI